MNLRPLLTLASVVAVLVATGPAHGAEPTPSADPRLVGPWHTVSIDGDALFFIVHGAEVDFDKDGSFTARIRFTDGETETKKGRYVLHGDHIELSIPSMKAKESLTYEIDGKNLEFHDESFGVKITVARGKAQHASGDDLF